MTQISLNLPELESERISLGEFLARPDAYNAPEYDRIPGLNRKSIRPKFGISSLLFHQPVAQVLS